MPKIISKNASLNYEIVPKKEDSLTHFQVKARNSHSAALAQRVCPAMQAACHSSQSRPVSQQGPAASGQAQAEPVGQPASQQPVSQPASQPATASHPVRQPASQPGSHCQPASQPATASHSQPASKPASQQASKPASKPARGATTRRK